MELDHNDDEYCVESNLQYGHYHLCVEQIDCLIFPWILVVHIQRMQNVLHANVDDYCEEDSVLLNRIERKG